MLRELHAMHDMAESVASMEAALGVYMVVGEGEGVKSCMCVVVVHEWWWWWWEGWVHSALATHYTL